MHGAYNIKLALSESQHTLTRTRQTGMRVTRLNSNISYSIFMLVQLYCTINKRHKTYSIQNTGFNLYCLHTTREQENSILCTIHFIFLENLFMNISSDYCNRYGVTVLKQMSVFQHFAYFPLARLKRSQRVRCVCVCVCVCVRVCVFACAHYIYCYRKVCLRYHDIANYGMDHLDEHFCKAYDWHS